MLTPVDPGPAVVACSSCRRPGSRASGEPRDGARLVAALDRVCILFDGLDDHALNVARDQWKSLKAAGASAQYWSEESGRWEKKAET